MPIGPELKKVLRSTTLEDAGSSHDAIVVGSGAAGGLAALMLSETGLRVLVLEAGLATPAWREPWRRIRCNGAIAGQSRRAALHPAFRGSFR